MTMKKMKRTKIVLLMMFSICLQHLHASTSNPKKTIHFVDKREEVVVHKNGVKPVIRHGGVAAAHGGAHGASGGHSGDGGGEGGGGGNPGVVIPVYAGASAHRTPTKNHHGPNKGEHNSTGLPQWVSTILALVLLLTYCC
ncbi:hypothetical protein HanPSC8_Chr13g0559531 [Helianthus annuus]|nr:hypothetical protein HanIR_Chr13g0632791 [Helianthus annuus]KAJ0848613.1 hypothetical protein HanPSC8_Chr13g0559531 [Helianthus annuus]